MADQITASLAQAKVLVMEGQKGADGKSPYIGENGNWFVWNGTAWADTGIPASMDDAQIAEAVADYLEEHPVAVTVDSALSSTSENPVQNKVINAALQTKGTYSKPSGGIPATDLAQAVQTSLSKADSAYQKPSEGIPASDLASGVIPTVPTKVSDLTNDSGYQTEAQVQTAISGKLDTNQGAANAGKFMVVGSDGNITAVTMSAWQGGSY